MRTTRKERKRNMWYLLYTDPKTGENKWDEVSCSDEDEAQFRIQVLAAEVDIDPNDFHAFSAEDD